MSNSIATPWNTSDVVHNILGCHRLASARFTTKNKSIFSIQLLPNYDFFNYLHTWWWRIGFRHQWACCDTYYQRVRRHAAGSRKLPVERNCEMTCYYERKLFRFLLRSVLPFTQSLVYTVGYRTILRKEIAYSALVEFDFFLRKVGHRFKRIYRYQHWSNVRLCF